MPLWVRYLIGVVLGVLLALVLAPYFPAPLDQLLYWVGWIVAAVCLVMAGLSFFRGHSAVR